MPNTNKEKILVPLDGSDRSLQTVKYVSQLEVLKGLQVVLFNVFSSVPDAYWDMEGEPSSTSAVAEIRAWEMQRKKEIRQFMDQAQEILLKAGFSPDALTIAIHGRQKGIARDIIKEARKDYLAVICRRRGLSQLPDFMIGSVATKLIEKLAFVPILIAGRKPPGRRILIAVDGSEDSLRAVDFMGMTLGSYGYKTHLLHVMRQEKDTSSKSHHLFFPETNGKGMHEKMVTFLDDAKDRLIASGCDPNAVTSQIVKGAHSRAQTIVKTAHEGDYGKIVLGRRGLSKVKEFFMGRVSHKVIRMAKDNAVWVIS